MESAFLAADDFSSRMSMSQVMAEVELRVASGNEWEVVGLLALRPDLLKLPQGKLIDLWRQIGNDSESDRATKLFLEAVIGAPGGLNQTSRGVLCYTHAPYIVVPYAKRGEIDIVKAALPKFSDDEVIPSCAGCLVRNRPPVS